MDESFDPVKKNGGERQREIVRRVDAERGEMIDVLRQRGIYDERLLAAMATVDRRNYVQQAFINRAYDD